MFLFLFSKSEKMHYTKSKKCIENSTIMNTQTCKQANLGIEFATTKSTKPNSYKSKIKIKILDYDIYMNVSNSQVAI